MCNEKLLTELKSYLAIRALAYKSYTISINSRNLVFELCGYSDSTSLRRAADLIKCLSLKKLGKRYIYAKDTFEIETSDFTHLVKFICNSKLHPFRKTYIHILSERYGIGRLEKSH